MALKKFGTNQVRPKSDRLGSFGGSSKSSKPKASESLVKFALLPKAITKGDRITVRWSWGPNSASFTGELTDVRNSESGDYMTIVDDKGVYFHYPAYLCDSIKKVRVNNGAK